MPPGYADHSVLECEPRRHILFLCEVIYMKPGQKLFNGSYGQNLAGQPSFNRIFAKQ